MAKEDQVLTAFTTTPGIYCYKVMPFGLKNVEATYQRFVNKMFEKKIGCNVEVYVDDKIVKSKQMEDHISDLREKISTLRTHNMKLNPKKCTFGVNAGKCFGFLVDERGIEANPNRIQGIFQMKIPQTVKEVWCLTGCMATLGR